MYREASIFYLNAPVFWCSLVLQDQPQGYIVSYFFKLVRVLPLCKMLFEFSLFCIFHHVWERKIQFMVFKFLENALNLCIFIHAPVPHSKLQAEYFENLFPPRRKGWSKLWCALWKFKLKTKMTWNISLFIFSMIYIFSKCDGFTVL